MNNAEKKFDTLESLIAIKLRTKRTRELHYAIRAMLVTELDEENHDANYSEILCSLHGPIVEIGGIEYSTGQAIKLIDPERYQDGFNNFLKEATFSCGYYYFYEDQIDEMIDFVRSVNEDALYETVYPREVAV